MNKILPIILVVVLSGCGIIALQGGVSMDGSYGVNLTKLGNIIRGNPRDFYRDEGYICNATSPASAVEEKLRLDFAIQDNKVVVGLITYPITNQDEYTITAEVEETGYVKFDKKDETLLHKQTNGEYSSRSTRGDGSIVVTNTDYHTMYQCKRIF